MINWLMSLTIKTTLNQFNIVVPWEKTHTSNKVMEFLNSKMGTDTKDFSIMIWETEEENTHSKVVIAIRADSLMAWFTVLGLRRTQMVISM